MKEFFKPTLRKILIAFLLALAIALLYMSTFGGYLLSNLIRSLLLLVVAYTLVCVFGKRALWFLIIIWVLAIIAFLYSAFQPPVGPY